MNNLFITILHSIPIAFVFSRFALHTENLTYDLYIIFITEDYKLAHCIVSSHFALHTENLTYDLYIIFYYRRRNNSPMAFVSSRFALSIENLNLALTSLLLQDTNNKYNDR